MPEKDETASAPGVGATAGAAGGVAASAEPFAGLGASTAATLPLYSKSFLDAQQSTTVRSPPSGVYLRGAGVSTAVP